MQASRLRKLQVLVSIFRVFCNKPKILTLKYYIFSVYNRILKFLVDHLDETNIANENVRKFEFS
mgnify:CR=1 FL=1